MKRNYGYASLLSLLCTICLQSGASCQDLKNIDLPGISFTGIAANLTKTARQALAIVADKSRRILKRMLWLPAIARTPVKRYS